MSYIPSCSQHAHTHTKLTREWETEGKGRGGEKWEGNERRWSSTLVVIINSQKDVIRPGKIILFLNEKERKLCKKRKRERERERAREGYGEGLPFFSKVL